MKTPAEIAEEVLNRRYIGTHTNSLHPINRGFEHAIALAAIEADRAQRAEPVDPDWQDDADDWRDAAVMDIRWRAWDANGRQIGYSDASITGAQAAAMFEAIGRTEA